MEKRAITITAILLLASTVNYLRIVSHSNIRVVEFISIFAMGILTGILLIQIIVILRRKK